MASVLPLLGGILNATARIGEYMVPPIKRQLNYMCCYSNNIKDLEDEVEKLDNIKTEVKLDVDAAKRNLQIIGPRVEKWLSEVEKIKKEKNDLSAGGTKVPQGCVYGMCPNLKLRYVLSRRAKKMTEKSIQLRDEGKFERVSYPPPPLKMVQYSVPTLQMDTIHLTEQETIESDSTSEFHEERVVAASQGHDTLEVEMDTSPGSSFESDNRFRTRKSTEEGIVNALQDPNVSMIGLCGMGGVGKTIMVRRIEEIVKERKMFDEVVMAVVAQHQNDSQIQNSIAQMLGLKLEAGNLLVRAKRLRNRIMNEKRILIILDDIWELLDLMEVGIPIGIVNCPCKILLTSRARDVCIRMGAQKILSLEVLSREEAWILFSEETDLSMDSSHLYPIAKKVANECKGLPIALISVARALKRRSKSSWEDALVQLKKSIPTNMIGVQANVYRPLELSYSHLEGHEVKSLFILCSLFREDSNIRVEDLVRYGLGLNMFEGVKNFREGRNRTHALIDILKDRFLLMDGHKEGYVKMHDVIRDVAISIRSKDKHVSMINGSRGWWSLKNSCEHCTHASLTSSISTIVPTWLNCPNLVFLSWECNNQHLKLPESIFEKLKTLKVLEIHRMDFPEIPSSVQHLTNLQALHFHNCKLGNISMIGYLVNLEILSFQGSDINILPIELGNLGKLRLFDLTDCTNLQQIAPGVISGLFGLEEISLPNSFKVCDVEEFEQLDHLTTLRILIGGQMVVPRKSHVLSKLEEYDISIGVIPQGLERYYDTPNRDKCSFQKTMALFLPTRTPLGEWISALLENAEDLRFAGDGFSSIMVEPSLRSCYLRQLAIQDCATVEHLATTTNVTPISFQILPVLESLFLHQLPNIKEICHGKLPERSFGELRYLHLRELPTLKHFCSDPIPNISLSNLRSICIYDCRNLQSLFCMTVARSLLQLEELEVGDCQEMKLVFSDDSEDRRETGYIEFPKLNKLVLRCLHGATNFVAVNRISIPQLIQLKMQALPQFTGFCFAKSSLFSSSDYNTDQQVLFNENVSCPRITRLALDSLNDVPKIFCHQGSGFLHNLLFLEVAACNGLKTLFSPSVARALVKLKELRVKRCTILVEVIGKENGAFMESSTNSSSCSQTPALFSELEFLEVYDCPKLQSILPLSVAQGLVKLTELRVLCCGSLVEVIGKDEQEQNNVNTVLFPQLRSLQLSILPFVESFCSTDCDFEIPSLVNVIIDRNSQLRKTLVKIAKNAEHMIRRQAGQASDSSEFQASCPNSASTIYASCKSHICRHEE